MQHRITGLDRSLSFYASITAAKTLKVIQGNDNFAEGNGTVTVQAIESDDPLAYEMIFAKTGHEALHEWLTDYKVVEELRAANNPFRFTIWNIIEDVRIEDHARRTRLPGLNGRMRRLMDEWAARGVVAAAPENSPPGQVLGSYLLHQLRSEVLGHSALAPMAAVEEKMLAGTFPAGVLVRLRGLMARIRGLESTADARDLADDILLMLKEEEQKERDRQNGGDAKEDTQGGGGTDEEQTSGADGDGADAGDQAGDGAKDGQDGEDGSEGGAGDGSDDGSGSAGQARGGAQAGGTSSDPGTDASTSSAGSTSPRGGHGGAESIAQALASGASDLAGLDMGSMLQNVLDSVCRTAPRAASVQMPRAQQLLGNGPRATALLNKVKSASYGARAQLEGLLQADRLEKSSGQTKGRRINGGQLYRLASGDTRVFVNRTWEEGENTALHLLLDRSDSMVNSMQLAVEATLALAWALDGLDGVSSGVTAFPGRSERGDTVLTLQRQGERLMSALPRFGAVGAGGGTPMAEGLLYGSFQLMLAEEPRKVLIPITDGAPNDWDATRRVLDRCAQSGIQVAAIGIGDQAEYVKSLFPVSAMISNVSDLRRALFEIARRLLA